MNARTVLNAGLAVAVALLLTGCIYEPAPPPAYGPSYYAYAPPPAYYYGPSVGVGIGFGGGWHDHYHRHWR